MLSKEYDFNVDDPIPKNDPVYGNANTGAMTIFDAVKHDPWIRAQDRHVQHCDGRQPSYFQTFELRGKAMTIEKIGR